MSNNTQSVIHAYRERASRYDLAVRLFDLFGVFGFNILLAVVYLLLAVCTPGCVPVGITAPEGSVASSAPALKGAVVSTLAGSGKIGPLGGGFADGRADQAQFHDPMGLACDARGNLYVSDWVNHRIRMISPDGRVTTVAGGGRPRPNGGLIDGPADTARFFGPGGQWMPAAISL